MSQHFAPAVADDAAGAGAAFVPPILASRSGQRVFTARRHLICLNDNQPLFVEGDPAHLLFTVVSGGLMILRQMADGRRQIVDIAGPGRSVGFTAGGRHDCAAVALVPSEVAARERHPGQDDAQMLAEIHRLRDLALLLGRKTAIERLATFLLEMMGEDFDQSQPLDFPVWRQDIADYLGLALETVCRNFVALKKRGLIAPANRESVHILDIDGLRRIASGAAAVETTCP
ncbi:hypothetical protein CCR94_23060 [Rhodoblastus sphagnicola]|uniref:Uncharacterized protein n=1 Tax=Rhodoblastus sphagnicola TaxID=333368 RepID=A0A2S6MUV2_9HYPH|nr:helix-turn-helix domain-containing protein [Rhodoblastus sphagnicola]MBB4199825.1 CRP-like cAMP-binding protein [Rhodoblastus sphagnicola]PPQ26145.1 hypothetical protein CCR94_23060 [Rhodoblastus sphagnicola]